MNSVISDIQKWKKEGCKYHPGIAVLEFAISNGFKAANFSLIKSARSSFSEKLLKSEIEKAELHFSPKDSKAPVQKVFGAIDVSTFPDDLKSLYNQTIANLKEMDTYRGRLQEIFYDETGNQRRSPDEKRAAAIAEHIHKLHQLNQDNWARLDYYRDHGTYLPGTEPHALSIERLIYLLRVQVKVKDYLQKAKKRIKDGQTIQIGTYNEYVAIDAEINKILNHE